MPYATYRFNKIIAAETIRFIVTVAIVVYKGLKLVVYRMLTLQPNSLPLLVGELVSEGQGGACASMNPVIQKLPETIPVVHVVSSEGCEAVSDRLHFSAAGYRELGKRYALTMLELLKKSK